MGYNFNNYDKGGCMELKKNKIRFLYYSCTITIVLSLVLLLSYTSFRTFNSLSSQSIDQLASGIYDMKKIYAKDVIDRTIQGIDIERARIIETASHKMKKNEDIIATIKSDVQTIGEVSDHLISDKILSPEIGLTIYDRNQEVITHSLRSDGIVLGKISEKDFISYFSESSLISELTFDDYIILQYISNDYIENQVKEIVANRIRSERLVDDGYIWINHIIDYSGGDNYAIRLVHPNIPETEGSFLSTNTQDIKGNYPYKEELNGINKDGELYYEYYFKKMNSDIIGHKLSYAKLYGQYEWVIATGVYLDDIDLLIENETAKMKQSSKDYLKRSLFFSFASLFFAITLIIIFEKQISNIISNFQETVSRQNIELQQEKELIEQIAYVDPLTKLLNRRAMISDLQAAFSKAQRHDELFSVVIGDLDYFKKINDNYGHETGDFVLTEVSDIIYENCRQEDSVSRWGGEEFLIVLNRANEESTYKKIDHIRSLIEEKEFNYNGHVINLTISFGFVTYNEKYTSYNEIVADADHQLYRSKHEGRNKVCGNEPTN